MGKPVAGSVVVVPFPHSDLTAAKRRPALVLVDLPGDDVVLCQITTQLRPDRFSVSLDAADFANGKLNRPSLIRPQRLFTADYHVLAYTLGTVKATKLREVLERVRTLFN